MSDTTAADSGEEQCSPFASMLVGLTTPGDPHRIIALVYLAVSLSSFAISTWTNNMSQIDWLWSLLPVAFSWICATDDRTTLMAVLVTIWMVRLKHTFYRRYGVEWPPWNREEDYRWEFIRSGDYIAILTNKYAFVVFNLVVISLYQTVLLVLQASPSLVAWTMANSSPCQREPLNLRGVDGLAAFLFLLSVTAEGVADNHQYAFQTEKYRRINAGEPLTGEYKDGFCQSGLFGVVRKPNYAAEQCVWISFYLFSVAAMGGGGGEALFNWSLVGCVLLLHLFHMSGKLTEGLTVKKYPKYAAYMERVPLYVPFTSPLLLKKGVGGGNGDKKHS